MLKYPVIQDGNEFYQVMSLEQAIHEQDMYIINLLEVNNILREKKESRIKHIESCLGFPIIDREKLLIVSDTVIVPKSLYHNA